MWHLAKRKQKLFLFVGVVALETEYLFEFYVSFFVQNISLIWKMIFFLFLLNQNLSLKDKIFDLH